MLDTNVSGFDLGILKAKILTSNNKQCIKTLTNEEIAKYIRYCNNLTREEKLPIVFKKINYIKSESFDNKDYLKKEVAKLSLLLKSIYFTKEEAANYWKYKESVAVNIDTGKVLIEVAANHPLIDGKPSKEFETRLKKAIELYNIEKDKGNSPIIYVPGSLHCITDSKTQKIHVDPITLSEAGKIFLMENGIPEKDIRANEANILFKGNAGVYNSADECFVATELAKKENCGRIISIASPIHLYRKALLYLEFGYKAEIYAPRLNKTAHNYIGEVFWSLYITYMNNQDWQTGFISYLTRKERNINYLNEIKDYEEVVNDIINNSKEISEDALEQKKEWLTLYNNAKENMDSSYTNNNNILIDLVRVKEKSDLEFKQLESIAKENPNINIDILYDLKDDISDINVLTNKYPWVRFIALKNRNERLIADTFITGNYKSLFGMYPSSISVKEAIKYIKEGVIPIVSSLPTNDSSYINNIVELYDEVLEPIKDKHNINKKMN